MFKQIVPGIYALLSEGGWSSNSYLVAEKSKGGCALIDPGLPENVPLLESALAELRLSAADVRLILNTHGHADHFGADFAFPEAEVLMHAHDAEFVNRGDGTFTCANFFREADFPKIKKFLADGQKIKFAGFVFGVVHAPGHTQGSVCFYERKKGMLFSGDTLFSGSFGRYDLPAGSREELLRSLKRLRALDFSVLLPGHGPILEGKARQERNLEACIAMLR
ncbi:MAG: MBL fold metallo-hydrolase [Candidatus Diapherotrites archaeon]